MDSESSASSPVTDKKYRAGSSGSNESMSATRLLRNQAEKQRRDRLNGYITELANIVPMVKNSTKPVDKVSVLRLAAAHMRLNLSCLNPKNFKSKIQTWPSSVIPYLELIEKNVGGFVVVTTFAGTVLFCSKCIEDFIGYQSINLMGQSIYNYVDTKEVTFFKKKVNSAILRSQKEKNFTKVVKLHFVQRPLTRSNDIVYQKMRFKISVHYNDSQDQISLSKTSQKSKKLQHKDYGTSSIVLMFIEPMKTDLKINRTYLLTHPDVYFTIHGLQGEIKHADHRISTITGYMPSEVQGKSAYTYILESDVPIAQFAQAAMFQSNDGMGLITYRLKIFDSSYIYLQTKGQIVLKENSTEMSHFICFNKWLSDEEGNRELIKFQERFAPQISASKATDAQDGKSDNKPLLSNSAVLNEEGTLNDVKNLNVLHSVEKSYFKQTKNFMLDSVKHNVNLPNDSTTLHRSSIQSTNGYSKLKDTKFLLCGSENQLVQSCSTISNVSKISIFDEIQQTTYQSDGNNFVSKPHLIESQVGSLNNECFSSRPEDLNEFSHINSRGMNDSKFIFEENAGSHLNTMNFMSKKLRPNEHIQLPDMYEKCLPVNKISSLTKQFSSIHRPINGHFPFKNELRNGDIHVTKQTNLDTINDLLQSSKVSQFNLEDPDNSKFNGKYVNSLNTLLLQTSNDCFSVNEISSFPQPCRPPLNSYNGVYWDNDKINSDVLSEKMESLNTINNMINVGSNQFYSNNAPTCVFTDIEQLNANSFCNIPENYQNFDSQTCGNDVNFKCIPSYNNSKFGSLNGEQNCNTGFGTKHVSLYPKGPDSSSTNDLLYKNGASFYNSVSVTNNNNSWTNETELPQQLSSENNLEPSITDMFLYPGCINPAKKMRTDMLLSKSYNECIDRHLIPTQSEETTCPVILSDIVLNGNHGHGKMPSYSEKASKTITKSEDFNDELYNELDLFFNKLPLPIYACKQNQVCEPPQSTEF